MSSPQPYSRRSLLRSQAYLAAWWACTGPRSSRSVSAQARHYASRTLGYAPPVWQFALVMNAYRRGWLDKAYGLPCQPIV